MYLGINIVITQMINRTIKSSIYAHRNTEPLLNNFYDVNNQKRFLFIFFFLEYNCLILIFPTEKKGYKQFKKVYV